MLHNRIHRITLAIILPSILIIACSSNKAVRHSNATVAKRSSIAVVIDSRNDIKNVVLTRFMAKGYNVKAFNASDLFSMDNIFDIKDFKKMSYRAPIDNSLLSMEKTYNNIYKLHLYNYEINKAELLREMSTKWGVQYLVILDLKNWEDTSWARIIDLRSLDIVLIENYPTAYRDTVETVVDHFITSMSKK